MTRMQVSNHGEGLENRSVIELAFAGSPELKERVSKAFSQDSTGKLQPLLTDIAHYVLEVRKTAATTGDDVDGPAAKRRKMNNGAPANEKDTAAFLNGSWAGKPFEGVSFAVPQRKKLVLHISPTRSEGIKAINPATSSAEFGIPWKQIEHVLCLPVPEKTQATKNFCIIPKEGGSDGEGGHGYEPIVWTASDTKARGDPEDAPTAAASIAQSLKAAKASVVEPTDKEFASQLQQVTRKGEKVYHVKAFKGSKDGFLFFLPTGIFWGFKKPLHFFAFADIASISYSSVLQRTFNLTVAALPTAGTTGAAAAAEPVEHEFSMVDQADFAGIDAYVKRHGLSDASMAAQRKAKRLNINGVKGEKPVEGEGEEGEEDESELKKAEREAEMQADDDEDEEDDENFDPGSEGESEGSGTSDEDDDDGAGQSGGEDIVAEELGSEAEEVEEEEEEEEG